MITATISVWVVRSIQSSSFLVDHRHCHLSHHRPLPQLKKVLVHGSHTHTGNITIAGYCIPSHSPVSSILNSNVEKNIKPLPEFPTFCHQWLHRPAFKKKMKSQCNAKWTANRSFDNLESGLMIPLFALKNPELSMFGSMSNICSVYSFVHVYE